ncbi:hypothetical protein IE53DRAFT_385030 [Violaceomyces palustris]|uniref:Uncharacterized protein n=1 Tax=Violaceomyces palustris TaxID=1673888 RepID=A0ACD0P390_9BASI|nr:hypothetical protein IE53DRAFT_385030 [Violaceomyces palustris]
MQRADGSSGSGSSQGGSNQEIAKPKLSFGFKPTKLSAPARPDLNLAATTPKPSLFTSQQEEEEEEEGEEERDGGPSSKRTSGVSHTSSSRPERKVKPAAAPASKADRRRQEEARMIESTVFDYDSVYDTMKEAEKKAKEKRQAENAERKPKYIGNFLDSAEQRKTDRLRAEAKMIQREREAEGDEFADKEAFVTNAYKEQQALLEKAEEEEREREERQRAKSKGMAGFYSKMLEESSLARQAAIEATTDLEALKSKVGEEGSPSAVKEEKTDIQLAKEAEERGLKVHLNDDNQIIDKRELLSKGLNILPKRKGRQRGSGGGNEEEDRKDANGHERSSDRGWDGEDSKGRDNQKARSSREAQRSRQSALIEEQMLELEKKRRREEEQALEEEKRKVMAKRNDERSVSSARERYLERKRLKEEEEKRKSETGQGVGGKGGGESVDQK